MTGKEAGGQGEAGAGGMVSTQLRFNKHLSKDPEAHEGSVLGKSKEPGLRHHWEKVMDTTPREDNWAISIKLLWPAIPLQGVL